MMNKIQILFFAQTRERLHCDKLEYSMNATMSVAQLKQKLQQKNALWLDVFQADLLCAVNQKLVSTEMRINQGDEVAFFPPVTGG